MESQELDGIDWIIEWAKNHGAAHISTSYDVYTCSWTEDAGISAMAAGKLEALKIICELSYHCARAEMAGYAAYHGHPEALRCVLDSGIPPGFLPEWSPKVWKVIKEFV